MFIVRKNRHLKYKKPQAKPVLSNENVENNKNQVKTPVVPEVKKNTKGKKEKAQVVETVNEEKTEE